ncbi:DUF1731 domain-containing protein, partial [Leptospira interrogans]|uniref:DUF1731 domain-containing protein n=1 Tax=Leptospira interrogans TaxID=173 RepID=UPI000AD61AE8
FKSPTLFLIIFCPVVIFFSLLILRSVRSSSNYYRKAVHRPWSPPAPKFIVKLGAFFIMKADSNLALTGRKCFPKRFIDLGFQFKHTTLLKTLEELV